MAVHVPGAARRHPQLSTFEFNALGFEAFVTNTGGLLAQDLEDIAEAVAVAAQENVGTQWSRLALNPAPGPPYRRSGDLQNSIRATPATVFGGTMESSVVADSAHRGFPYPLWLRIQGYEFVDLASFQG